MLRVMPEKAHLQALWIRGSYRELPIRIPRARQTEQQLRRANLAAEIKGNIEEPAFLMSFHEKKPIVHIRRLSWDGFEPI